MKRLARIGALCAIAITGCSHNGSVPVARNDGTAAHNVRQVLNSETPAREPNSLIDADGTLYGTTIAGGAANLGEVFSATTGGVVTPLYAFKVGDQPSGRPIAYNKNLYGMTVTGTAGHGDGMVFGITQAAGKEILAHYFRGAPKDGARPAGGLRVAGGLLYGTTASGGSGACPGTVRGCGTIFEVNPQTAGVEFVDYSFKNASSDGQHPNGDLISAGGNLYGTTRSGGSGSCSGGCGTVFAFDLSTGQERIVYSFQNNGADATNPNSGLIDVKGMLYGTAASGPGGNGAVFEIDPSNGTESVVHSFAGGANDGANPAGGLMSLNGVLYGTTANGGLATCGSSGCGTVYQITVSSGQEGLLYRFNGGDSDGQQPIGGVVALDGTLYGTTEAGGENGRGSLFSLSLTGTEAMLYSF